MRSSQVMPLKRIPYWVSSFLSFFSVGVAIYSLPQILSQITDSLQTAHRGLQVKITQNLSEIKVMWHDIWNHLLSRIHSSPTHKLWLHDIAWLSNINMKNKDFKLRCQGSVIKSKWQWMAGCQRAHWYRCYGSTLQDRDPVLLLKMNSSKGVVHSRLPCIGVFLLRSPHFPFLFLEHDNRWHHK